MTIPQGACVFCSNLTYRYLEGPGDFIPVCFNPECTRQFYATSKEQKEQLIVANPTLLDLQQESDNDES